MCRCNLIVRCEALWDLARSYAADDTLFDKLPQNSKRALCRCLMIPTIANVDDGQKDAYIQLVFILRCLTCSEPRNSNRLDIHCAEQRRNQQALYGTGFLSLTSKMNKDQAVNSIWALPTNDSSARKLALQMWPEDDLSYIISYKLYSIQLN